MTRVSRQPRSTAPGQRQRASSRFGRLIITTSESNSRSPPNTKENPARCAGDGHGIATIQGNTAIFRPDGADVDCQITLKFKRHNLVIAQTGRCDFGKYANVDGTYKKVSTSKPIFRFALAYVRYWHPPSLRGLHILTG
jgi:hypothetical protein